MQLVRDEEKIKINIPLFLLPSGSKEGDILNVTIAKGVKETEAAKERVTNFSTSLKISTPHFLTIHLPQTLHY